MRSALLALAACALAACGPSGPTWHDDIAPIVEQSCAGCHPEFTAESAPRYAQRMAAAVASGKMPPFLAAPIPGIRYSNDPRLPPDKVALLTAWAADPQHGAPRQYRPAPATGELYEGEPYAPGGADEIRCFLLRPRPGFFVGYRWSGAGAHHFEATVVPAEGAAVAEARGGAGGWGCADAQYDIPTKASLVSTNPRALYRYPTGYGVELTPGDALVLYVHLTPGEDRSSARRFGMVLEYGTPGRPVVQHGWNAPSEVPCPPALAAQPQCQREWARSRALLGAGLPTPEEQVARCGPQTFEPSANGTSMVVRSRCRSALPPGRWRWLGVRAHMHLQGLSARVSDDSRLLLDIPRWDYRFEGTYAPVEDVELGAYVTIECAWQAGDRYRTFELSKAGEMCVGSVVLGSL